MIETTELRPRQPPSKGTARTEVEVAADVIARLINRGALRGDSEALSILSRVVGLPTLAIKSAIDHQKRFGYRDPRNLPAGAGADLAGSKPPDPVMAKRHKSQQSTPTYLAKNPSPTTRVCSDCEKELPIDGNFTVKSWNTDMTPLYHYRCDLCRSKYQRRRYLSVQAEHTLGALIRFVLDKDDEISDQGCPYCPEPLLVGDDVAGVVRVAHAHCLLAALEMTSAAEAAGAA